MWILLREAQAIDLASGYVPGAVRSMVRELLEAAADDRRRAARPVRRRRKRR